VFSFLLIDSGIEFLGYVAILHLPFYFFGATVDWTEHLVLARQVLYHLRNGFSPSLSFRHHNHPYIYVLNTCQAIHLFFWWDLMFLPRTSLSPCSTYLCLLCCWYYRKVSPCPSFLVKLGLTFCLGWPESTILLISASGVAGITDMNDHTNLYLIFEYLPRYLEKELCHLTYLPVMYEGYKFFTLLSAPVFSIVPFLLGGKWYISGVDLHCSND
jgi:hypothetical protein